MRSRQSFSSGEGLLDAAAACGANAADFCFPACNGVGVDKTVTHSANSAPAAAAVAVLSLLVSQGAKMRYLFPSTIASQVFQYRLEPVVQNQLAVSDILEHRQEQQGCQIP